MMIGMLRSTVFALFLTSVIADASAQSATAKYARDQLEERGFVNQNGLLQEDFIEQCVNGKSENVKLFLLAGANPNATGQSGNAALIELVDQNYTAVHTGHVEVLKALIQAGADLSVRDQIGRTAFVIASLRKNLELLEVLLEAKAQE